jgi:hypothetical protein
MPVQSARRAGGVAGQRLCAHEHGRHGLILAARGCATVCARADWLGFAGGARAAAWARDGDSFPRGDGGAQQRTVERPYTGVAGQRIRRSWMCATPSSEL